MFPVHGYVNPCCQTFPHHTEPNSYPRHYYYPGWGEVMPQMKADPFNHQLVFVPSPYPFNENICPPKSGCCYHSCSPDHFNFRPQSSHVQPPPQVYHYGPYPPYPDGYPAYFLSPAHYSVNQPHYEYDKAQSHCCGCPNHTCHRRDDISPKIEEQKPGKEQQDGDSSGLIRLPKYPSPVVWVPASSTIDTEGDKDARLQSGCWNGWMPLDINSLKGSRQEDAGKKGQQNEDKWSQKWSPFPNIWMPSHDKPEGLVKDLKEITPKSVEDWPSKFKIVPLKLLENENDGERSKCVQEEPESRVQSEAPVEKERKTKTIPVKQMEERNQKKASIPEKQEEKVGEKMLTSFEKPNKKREVNKTSENKRSSPIRSSKLPPVCLRVDPLPRKKTINGASRSPSSHGPKDKTNSQRTEEQSPGRETREEISEKVIPVSSVKDKPDKDHKCQESASVASSEDSSKASSVQEPSVKKTARHDDCLQAKKVSEGGKIEGEKDCVERMFAEAGTEQKIVVHKGHVESSESKDVKEKKETKWNLSQTDAAILIQSAYRGLEVRRWHPLEKLKKIAKIREQAGNIRRQLQSIEALSMVLDAKQRIVIGETIMSLLLE